jgi:glucose/mannose-6-phosphate isomerase
MMDLVKIQKIDSQNMYQIYDLWPKIARESYDYDYSQIEFKNIDHIVFAGMGGSGAIGDIFASILSKTNIHVTVVKGYILPKTVDSNTLVINTSVSGNTVETLTILKSIVGLDCKTISFSSGGKMEEFCNKNNLEYRKISFYHSPRASFVSFLYSMLKILKNIIPVKNEDVQESLIYLEKICKKISSNNLTQDNPALKLAEWITDIPLIYYPHGLESAAIHFKNSLQENAKMHVFSEDVIEACHNGIVSWEKKSNVQPIILQGNDDYVKTKERWKILKNYFNEKDIDFWEINSVKGSILSKLVCMIYLLDYSTIYKAVLSDIDPSPVKSITYFKNNL